MNRALSFPWGWPLLLLAVGYAAWRASRAMAVAIDQGDDGWAFAMFVAAVALGFSAYRIGRRFGHALHHWREGAK